MKLPIGCPIWNPLKHEYYRFLIPMFLRLEGNVPPLGMKKLDLRSMWHFGSGWCGSGWCTPQGMKKLDLRSRWYFWFWMMYPPRNEKVGFQVKVTFLVLDDVPPIDWNKHECYRKQLGSASTFYQSIPPTQYNIILCLNRKLVNFNFNWIWIHGLKPHPPPLSSSKIEMLTFGLHSTSDDWTG